MPAVVPTLRAPEGCVCVGAAPELEPDEVVPFVEVPFVDAFVALALFWNCAKVLLSLALMAKTIPISQWSAGIVCAQ